MADAGGTTTLELISNVGQYPLYMIRNDDVDSTETIPLDSVADFVSAEDKVMVVGALNETTESQAADGTLTVAYDETAMHFTVTESGITGDAVQIFFYYLG